MKATKSTIIPIIINKKQSCKIHDAYILWNNARWGYREKTRKLDYGTEVKLEYNRRDDQERRQLGQEDHGVATNKRESLTFHEIGQEQYWEEVPVVGLP